MGFAPTPLPEMYKGIKPDRLPRHWYNYYVVYQYEDRSVNWESKEYIVGFDSIESADSFADDLKAMASKIADKRPGFQTVAKSVDIMDHLPRRFIDG